MLHSPGVINSVIKSLSKINIRKIILDPVMAAKGGAKLIDNKSIQILKKKSQEFNLLADRAQNEMYENYFHQATAYALMFQEQTGMKIENIVIMIANEDGTNQIFVKKPLSYVKGLYESIKTFYEDNGWL